MSMSFDNVIGKYVCKRLESTLLSYKITKGVSIHDELVGCSDVEFLY